MHHQPIPLSREDVACTPPIPTNRREQTESVCFLCRACLLLSFFLLFFFLQKEEEEEEEEEIRNRSISRELGTGKEAPPMQS
jgi:hypothetical protein